MSEPTTHPALADAGHAGLLCDVVEVPATGVGNIWPGPSAVPPLVTSAPLLTDDGHGVVQMVLDVRASRYCEPCVDLTADEAEQIGWTLIRHAQLVRNLHRRLADVPA
jgi:hypothetical protein